MFRKWKAKRQAKRRQQMRDRLARDLWFCHENENRGLLLRHLVSMPSITETTFFGGGWRDCSVEVVMKDGFTIVEYGRRPRYAIRKAARAIVERLKDIHCLREANLSSVDKETMTSADAAKSFTHRRPEPNTTPPSKRPISNHHCTIRDTHGDYIAQE